MFTRILVPMDFSAPSDAAPGCARVVVTAFNATVDAIIGSPAGCIVDYAGAHEIDLIVDGHTGPRRHAEC